MKAAEVAVQMLVASGVRYFAGMVGSTTVPFVATVAGRSDARFIPVRHEQVAAGILDATARLTRRPGCVVAHSASGTLAASLGVAAAARDFTPMIVVSGTHERQAHRRAYWQTMDVLAPLSAAAKWQYRVEQPEAIPEVIRRALTEATAGCPGVVQLDIPIDVALAEIDPPAEGPAITYEAPLFRPGPSVDEIARAAALLRRAERPVILAGGGAAYSGAGAELRRLAERLSAPVVVEVTSRGVVPEDHPLVLGPAGIVGYPPAGAALHGADLLLAIGTRISDLPTARGTLLPESLAIVHVNLDPSEIGRLHPVALGVVADARAFVAALNAHLDGVDLTVPSQRAAWAAELKRNAEAWREDWLAGAPDNGRVQPHEIVRTLLDALPPDAFIAHGAGDHQFYGQMVPVRQFHGHLLSGTLGAMGEGVAYALGAKLVHPDRPVVACVGDGDLMLQLGDLETMVRERLAVTVVVFNNFRLGSQRPRMEAYGRVAGVDHGNPDFAKLAELFGCDGYRVDRPGQLRAVFERAIASNRPVLIDVIVDPDAQPPRIQISRQAR